MYFHEEGRHLGYRVSVLLRTPEDPLVFLLAFVIVAFYNNMTFDHVYILSSVLSHTNTAGLFTTSNLFIGT